MLEASAINASFVIGMLSGCRRASSADSILYAAPGLGSAWVVWKTNQYPKPKTIVPKRIASHQLGR